MKQQLNPLEMAEETADGVQSNSNVLSQETLDTSISATSSVVFEEQCSFEFKVELFRNLFLSILSRITRWASFMTCSG
jgi:hypothetical protein